MRIAIVSLLVFCISSFSIAAETVKVKEATIRGEIIMVGQGADIVQNRIKADQFVASGYNYGDTSKGYYNDGGSSYIITYGPPKSGTGAYVVQQIEKVTEKRENPATAGPQVTMGMIADTVLERRGKAISVKQIGSDEKGLLVEWQYPDATYLMGRRLQGGIEAYRVIKITQR
ncbi:MAG: hypothetical protein V2B19_16805 [Pseudomonadota bacterium]